MSSGKMTIRVKSWNGVAAWRWKVDDELCGICRMPFDGCCSDCRTPGDGCTLVWGVCRHVFHMHCIMKWLNSQAQADRQKCPMCRRDWEFVS